MSRTELYDEYLRWEKEHGDPEDLATFLTFKLVRSIEVGGLIPEYGPARLTAIWMRLDPEQRNDILSKFRIVIDNNLPYKQSWWKRIVRRIRCTSTRWATRSS